MNISEASIVAFASTFRDEPSGCGMLLPSIVVEVASLALAFPFGRFGRAEGLYAPKDRPFVLRFVLHFREVFCGAFLMLAAPLPKFIYVHVRVIRVQNGPHTVRNLRLRRHWRSDRKWCTSPPAKRTFPGAQDDKEVRVLARAAIEPRASGPKRGPCEETKARDAAARSPREAPLPEDMAGSFPRLSFSSFDGAWHCAPPP